MQQLQPQAPRLVAPLEPSQGPDDSPSPTAPLSGFLLGGIIAQVLLLGKRQPAAQGQTREENRAMC